MHRSNNIIGMDRNKALWLTAIVIATVLSLSFREIEPGFSETNWLVTEVDTAATGYFKVNPANRVLLRFEKRFRGHDLYLLNGSTECCKEDKIKDRSWSDCWLATGVLAMVKLDPNQYRISVLAGNVDHLYFSNMLSKLEYKGFMLNFLQESDGKVILNNDTLTFDMKVMRMGKEVPFKIKCVRDTLGGK
jgi:hypothetical protein